MSEVYDYIVVGSGPSGAMAAQTLVEAGKNVLMLDAGIEDQSYPKSEPKQDFLSLRKSDALQHNYLLGKTFEGIDLSGSTKTGAQLTPARKYLGTAVEKWLPTSFEQFDPLESLAYGGLGSGWGLGCCVFSKKELQQVGLPPETMQQAYQTVADRIGISGHADDAAPFTHAMLDKVQPSIPIDGNHEPVLKRYESRKKWFQQHGYHLGRPALALLTEQKDDRQPTALNELEFYSDAGKSAWRSWITIDELRRASNFTYCGAQLMVRFEDRAQSVIAHTIDMASNESHQFEAKHLVLAAGALGTARIVGRSASEPVDGFTLLCNPYVYVPCLQIGRLGKDDGSPRSAMAQLSLFHANETESRSDIAMASFYSYRSLLLNRVVGLAPMGVRDARLWLQYLVPAMSIVGIHTPDWLENRSALQLEPDPNSPTGDRLRDVHINTQNGKKIGERFLPALRKLGLRPLKIVEPPFGASIHYAGTLVQTDFQPFQAKSNGQLNSCNHVWIADGSSFQQLPAKGITLTLMANAHRVAQQALRVDS